MNYKELGITTAVHFFVAVVTTIINTITYLCYWQAMVIPAYKVVLRTH